MGEIRKAYKILFGKPEGKRPLGRTRRGWRVIITVALTEIAWGRVDWMHLAQDMDHWRTLSNTVMNFCFP
jgi:hypothetical protein